MQFFVHVLSSRKMKRVSWIRMGAAISNFALKADKDDHSQPGVPNHYLGYLW